MSDESFKLTQEQLDLAKLMEAALDPQPMEDRPQNCSWVSVDGNIDRGVVISRNGHEVGWLSGFRIAQAMDALKGRAQWVDGRPARFTEPGETDSSSAADTPKEEKP